jgi:lipoate-protein ligase A
MRQIVLKAVTPLFSKVYCVDTGFHTGEENMEFDRKMMAAFLDGRFQKRFGSDSCLWRFYAWRPYAITLGYNQEQSDIDLLVCRTAGIDVVRRPTGGRAVFHAEEFTYSFFAESPEHNSVLYRMVHEVIRLALEGFGIEAEFCRSTLARPNAAPAVGAVSCFTASARYELQVDGRKLVGSAQRRTRDVLLQHGSLPLSVRHKELCRFIAFSEGGAFEEIRDEIEKKAISLEEILGYIPEYSRIAERMMHVLGGPDGSGGVQIQPGDLSDFLEDHEQSIH